MKTYVTYVTHKTEKRELKNPRDATQVKIKYQTEIGCLDEETQKIFSLRMMTDLPVEFPLVKLGQKVEITLRPIRGDWEDTLGVSGLSAVETPVVAVVVSVPQPSTDPAPKTAPAKESR